MTTISVDDVQKLAQLSALTITDDQAQVMSKELTTILDYVQQLEAVDTADIAPTYQGNDLENVTRHDEVIEYGVDQAGLMKNAPKHQHGSLEVPRVIE